MTLLISKDCLGETESVKSDCEKWFSEIYSISGTERFSRKYLKNSLANAKSEKLAKIRIASTWNDAATYYLELRDLSKAGECLKNAMESKQPFEIMNFTFPFIAADPQFEPLKEDDNFKRVLAQIGLS